MKSEIYFILSIIFFISFYYFKEIFNIVIQFKYWEISLIYIFFGLGALFLGMFFSNLRKKDIEEEK